MKFILLRPWAVWLTMWCQCEASVLPDVVYTLPLALKGCFIGSGVGGKGQTAGEEEYPFPMLLLAFSLPSAASIKFWYKLTIHLLPQGLHAFGIKEMSFSDTQEPDKYSSPPEQRWSLLQTSGASLPFIPTTISFSLSLIFPQRSAGWPAGNQPHI